MKIVQLSSSRAQEIPELGHLHLLIKFKRHRSQRFCFDAQSSTLKIYVELSISKKCRDQRASIKNCSPNLSLCIQQNSLKKAWWMTKISIVYIKINFTKSHHQPWGRHNHRLRKMILSHNSKLIIHKQTKSKIMHQKSMNPTVWQLKSKYIKSKMIHWN